jgi:hypothetical protein
MWSELSNRFRTPSTAALAIDAMLAITTSVLASVFVFAAVLPPLGSVLVG